MRHQKYRNTLNLKTGRRTALLNNLVISLIKHNRITTTHKKAKVASQLADKLITLAKKKNLHAQRKLFVYLKSRELVKYVVDELAPRFANRTGGYTRIIRYKNRIGDGALLSLLEFTEIPDATEKSVKKKRAKKQPKKAQTEAEEKKGKDISEKAPEDIREQKEEDRTEKDEDIEKRTKKAGFFTNLRGFLKK